MSLKPTGMPSRAPFSPRARRSSARLASARLLSGSTVMKAFSSPFRRWMRAKNARVSSTEETFFASSAPASSSRVAFSKLLDHLGHEVEVTLDRRRDGLIKLVPVAFRDFVHAQALADLLSVRHGRHVGDIDRTHLLDEGEHAVQALEHLGGFFRGDGDPGQRGNPAHVVVG